ncbi:MAG: efflux RND transporter periplasmic adaptor subunit [Candidatus Roizmanbacteria bacterium]|nr:efflux RND transporter periplasmic adaptor subunit [Candidatus Roizmanbacteria bacterium]
MKLIPLLRSKLTVTAQKILKLPRIALFIAALIMIGAGWLFYSKVLNSKSTAPTYQTAIAEKGTLVVSTSASGQVSTDNTKSISTSVSGVVKDVKVKNGDLVSQGDPLVEIELDQPSQQNYLQALSSYQGAKNSLDSAQNQAYKLQADMFSQWDTFRDLATNSTYQNSDGSTNDVNRALPEFHIAQNNWLASEAAYKNQTKVIAQSQTSLASSSLALQESSPTIYAPISGTVSGLSLQKGTVLSANTSGSTSGTTSSRVVASIKTDAHPTISVNLTEIDVPHVKPGNKVTITIDSIPDKSYTGTVISVDTVGGITSGVTAYPAVIQFDDAPSDIYPNMSAQVSIITNTKDNVLLIPASAVQNTNGQSYIQILKNGSPTQIDVEIGASSDTQTEIVSGLTGGEEVITSTISTSNSTQQTGGQASPFSSFGGTRGGSGFSGQIRTR